MKKAIAVFLSFTFALSACAPADPAPSGEAVPESWVQVDGHVIETAASGEAVQILVASGLKDEEAADAQLESRDLRTKASDMIWLTDESISLDSVRAGDRVSAWWDEGKPHQEPGVLTVPAEKIEVAR